MRRMGLGLFAMAALAVASNSAFAGHTAAEVLMFLGDGVVNPDGTEAPSFTGGTTPAVDALPGDTVSFPIYVQNMDGQYAHTLVGYSFDSWTSTALLPAISGASVSHTGVPGWSGANSAGSPDGVTNDAVFLVTRLTKRTYDSVATLPEGLAGGPVHVGWLNIGVSALAMDGDSIPLMLGVGEGAAAGLSGFATNPGAPGGIGGITGAFGWDTTGVDGIGGVNTYRQQNPATDVVATTVLHRSTLADGSINIIPEPATMGLLGLGLLAIRRRRA